MKIRKRDYLQCVIDNKPVDVIPVALSPHFVLGKAQFSGLYSPEILQSTTKGHVDFYTVVQPDMMKIMNEGFLGYPPIMNKYYKEPNDLLKIKSLGPDDPWIKEQVKHVGRIYKLFKREVMCFYNLYSPLQFIKLRLERFDNRPEVINELAMDYPDELQQACQEILKDIMFLAEQLYEARAIDGIFFNVQNINIDGFSSEMYRQFIEPSELPFLQEVDRHFANNILHISPSEFGKNNLELYREYPAEIYSWSTQMEGLSLKDGKKLFGGACVMGGFDHRPSSVILNGNAGAIKQETLRILDTIDFNGFILGAGEPFASGVDLRLLRVVREACRDYANKEL